MRCAAFRPGCGEPVPNDTGYEKIKNRLRSPHRLSPARVDAAIRNGL